MGIGGRIVRRGIPRRLPRRRSGRERNHHHGSCRQGRQPELRARQAIRRGPGLGRERRLHPGGGGKPGLGAERDGCAHPGRELHLHRLVRGDRPGAARRQAVRPGPTLRRHPGVIPDPGPDHPLDRAPRQRHQDPRRPGRAFAHRRQPGQPGRARHRGGAPGAGHRQGGAADRHRSGRRAGGAQSRSGRRAGADRGLSPARGDGVWRAPRRSAF